MHKTIPIMDNLGEVTRERSESNFGRLSIVEQFHGLGETS